MAGPESLVIPTFRLLFPRQKQPEMCQCPAVFESAAGLVIRLSGEGLDML